MNKPKPQRTPPEIKARAKDLRKHTTPAEKALWDRVRNRRLNGLKFRRQCPIGPFIADFYCAAHRLIVEVDGDIHDLQVEEDQARTQQFEDYGYRVIRFRNDEIEKDIEAVLAQIFEACE